MAKRQPDLLQQLHNLVKEAGLGRVLVALTLVSHDNGARLACGARDQAAARVWSRLADKLERLSREATNAGL